VIASHHRDAPILGLSRRRCVNVQCWSDISTSRTRHPICASPSERQRPPQRNVRFPAPLPRHIFSDLLIRPSFRRVYPTEYRLIFQYAPASALERIEFQ
jgi:hypothetical protein